MWNLVMQMIYNVFDDASLAGRRKKGAVTMPNQKHLTLDYRSRIQTGLTEGRSFCQIAKSLDKDPSSISKEVRKHRVFTDTGATGRVSNKCVHKTSCKISGICSTINCRHLFCRACKNCNSLCQDFEQEHCKLLSQSPYVCNGCKQRNSCVLTKYFYRALAAHNKYLSTLSSCREGLSYTEAELQWMDEIISPLVKKKQSLHHICVTQSDKLLCSERTIYKFINESVLSVRNIDLPRQVRYRPRQRIKPLKVDKGCRLNRTYKDYLSYILENPETQVVQMDSVEGVKGGKTFLTVFFKQSDLLLIHLRDHNTSQSVIDFFNHLDEVLGRELFSHLFQVLLADNGTEFSNPSAIEFDASGQRRTRIFYCDPSSPHQKPEIERSHEFIRMVLPKGSSFDGMKQSDATDLACQINSLVRKKLSDQSPMTTFSFFHGDEALLKLGLAAIPPEEVTLARKVFGGMKEVDSNEKDL